MKLSKLKRGDIVLVTWEDACSSARWWTDSEVKHWAKTGVKCESVGFYFGVNKKNITLYTRMNPEEMGGLMNIPISCIKKIKLL